MVHLCQRFVITPLGTEEYFPIRSMGAGRRPCCIDIYDNLGPLLSALVSVSWAYLFCVVRATVARDEVHITGRDCFIVIPDPDCVGGGLGHACALLWLPAGRV